MHVLVIAVFALVLATRPVHGVWWHLVESPEATLAIVGAEFLLFFALVIVGTWLTGRRLDRDGQHDVDGPRFHSRVQLAWRITLFVLTVALIELTPWVWVVRRAWGLGWIYGLSDLVVLTPFLFGAIGAWVIQYPVDRRIRELATASLLLDGRPARPVWRLGEYLSFHIRHHLLLIVVPMAGVLVLRDAQLDFGPWLEKRTGLDVAGHLAFLVGVGVVFLFSPVMMRYIWSTAILPPSALRDRLESLCKRIDLRYRAILVWRSQGVMVNAAVMGVVGPLRYILLSDGLLESMDDDKIEAVFGHEVGHVVHHHIPFYLAFAILTMLAAGGVLLLLLELPQSWQFLAELVPLLLVVTFWLIGFGWISRRFERQADLYGARSITPTPERCVHPCRVHPSPAPGADEAATPAAPAEADSPPAHALCRTAAETFAAALERIAFLNGISPKARSWRHSSIGSRMEFLRQLAAEPEGVHRFQRVVLNIKIALAVGMAIALPATVVLYVLGLLPRQLFGY